MATKVNRALAWIRYSGATVIVRVNPCHWIWWPEIEPRYQDTWAGPRERTIGVSWLMLTVRVWIDDGSW